MDNPKQKSRLNELRLGGFIFVFFFQNTEGYLNLAFEQFKNLFPNYMGLNVFLLKYHPLYHCLL
jgi:hypothetical protein